MSLLRYSLMSVIFTAASSLIYPVTGIHGEVDLNSLATHVQLLEQMLQRNNANTHQLELMVNTLQGVVKNLDMRVAKNSEDIQALTREQGSKPNGVAFEASLDHHLTNLKDHDILKFDVVKLNQGGGYNNASGIFTAPLPGTYMFFANIMHAVNDGTDMWIFIHRGDQIIAKGYTVGSNTYDVASITALTHLEKGDNVWFTKDSGTNRFYGNDWSNIGGCLISAT